MTNDLPSSADSNVMDRHPRVGPPDAQRACRARLWGLLETYRLSPERRGLRISNDALGSRGWQVQFMRDYQLANPYRDPSFGIEGREHLGRDEISAREEAMLGPLARAARDMGVGHFIALAMDPDRTEETAVWRLPLTARAIVDFFNGHIIGGWSLLVPEGEGFAVLKDNDLFAILAGPPEFLRRALPPVWQGLDWMAEVIDGAEGDVGYGPGCLDDDVAHYRDFLFEG